MDGKFSAVTIAVVDGIGGGLGAQIVERLRREKIPGCTILALGANAVATQRMVDAGADRGASGENAVRVSAVAADFIIGPIGIVLPNAMMGEITSAMAEAVLCARAKKLLLPLNQPHVQIVGLGPRNVNDLISDALLALKRALSGTD
jgi:hypothetical protein